MFELLKTTDASGVIVISGDRHLGEISVLPSEFLGYPLYEITSSGLNSALGENSDAKYEPNSFRIRDENVLVDNFGSIQISSNGEGIELKLQIRDKNGNKLQEKVVALESLKK